MAASTTLSLSVPEPGVFRSSRSSRSSRSCRPRVLAYGKVLWHPAPSFVAIDLRTLDGRRNSLCAVGAVRVEHGVVVDRFARLVRPRAPARVVAPVDRLGGAPRVPSRRELAGASSFLDLWPSLRALLDGVAFVATHDALFVASVLDAACEGYGLPRFDARYEHTASLARRVWDIDAESPSLVAAALGLTARPDDVLSTAESCADIVLAAWAA